MAAAATTIQPVTDATSNNSFVPSANAQAPKSYTAEDIPKYLQLLQKPNATYDELLLGITGFRKMLSIEKDPPVEAVLNCGVLPAFVNLLDAESTKLRFEAAWSLTNIASTEYTRTVAEYGAVPKLVQLLLSNDANVREQSAWCLGNVAGDSYDLRDLVLAEGALSPL